MNVVLTVTAGPHQGKVFSFAEHDSFIVGRSKKAEFRLPLKDRYFSRVHFLIEVNPPLCRVVDLNSRNGTKVNGKAVLTATLNDGDVIQAGRSELQVRIEQSPELQATLIGRAEDSTPKHGDLQPSHEARPETGHNQSGSTDNVAHGLTIEESRSGYAPCVVRPDHLSLLPDNFTHLIAIREQLLPGYQIVDEIGRGAMGVVYRAVRVADGCVVALKTILPAKRQDRRAYQFFLREAQILRQLRHPHIVRCDDVGEAEGFLYFAMEYVPALNAQQMLDLNPQPLSEPAAVGVMCQMLEALHAAHQQGFVHRDVKPSNVLVQEVAGRDVVKLTDFGLARVYQASSLSGLTMTGQFGGTMAYIAPEQITSFRDCQPQSDQYSAAATLYHLLTRKYIYDLPEELGQQIRTVLEAHPIPIEQYLADIPKPLAQAIHKALSRDPADRFPSCAEFREALLPIASRG